MRGDELAISTAPRAALRYAERATIKVGAAPVYSHQRGSKEEIVTSLKRGDVVFVEFSISSPEGDWCKVREAAGTKVEGYMLCADLQALPPVVLTSEEHPTRDYSTQSSRLVGRWASAEPKFAAIECHYYGPVEKKTRTGALISYRLVAVEPHFIWKRYEHKYRILSEDGERVITGILPQTVRPITQSHSIDPSGCTSHQKTIISALQSELDGGDYTYIDGKDLPCSENNARWKAEDLASKAAASLAAMQQMRRDGDALAARARTTLKKHAEERAAPPPAITRAKYYRIQDGMSYEQVRAIIGAAGEEISRSSLAGYTTVMYSWKNSNGSNMNVMFQNGRLVNKAQFGLP